MAATSWHTRIRRFFHWQYSGVLITFFWTAGLAVAGIALTYDDAEIISYLFNIAYVLLAAGSGWAIGYKDNSAANDGLLDRRFLIAFATSKAALSLAVLSMSVPASNVMLVDAMAAVDRDERARWGADRAKGQCLNGCSAH